MDATYSSVMQRTSIRKRFVTASDTSDTPFQIYYDSNVNFEDEDTNFSTVQQSTVGMGTFLMQFEIN